MTEASGDVARGPTLPAKAPDSAADTLAAGVRAGEYVVEWLIGTGAMGEVYAGRHPLIGKRVAIKVLKPSLCGDADAADRFLREARVGGQIDHANVVDVFGFGRLDDGRLYLAMDFVDGKSLRALLASGPIPAAQALDLLAQIASALDHAHARGVVHRDLKPDNIVVDHGTPKVLDFGLAKLVSQTTAEATDTLTARGTWLGTPGYMAPEQWSADGATAASDRYALGVIAFELLAGRLPFDATSVPQMMEQHFRAAVPPLTTRGGTTTAYDRVLARAMAKDPEARFATATAMVDALRAASGLLAGGAAPARRSYVAAIAAVAVLGAGIGVAAWVHGGDDEPETQAVAPSPANPVAPAVARPHVHVVSEPAGAHVLAGGHDLGMTPIDVDLRAPAGSGSSMTEVSVRAPGYAGVSYLLDAARAGSTVKATLTAVDGFAGVWRLPSGELRAFKRQSDGRVDGVVVSKLDAVKGAQALFRRYEFTAVDAVSDADVDFGGTEDVSMPLPGVPDCTVSMKVDYRYRSDGDVLELRKERVALDNASGSCVAHDRAPGEFKRLVRVDGGHGTTTWVEPPAGGPPKVTRSAVTTRRNPKAVLLKQKDDSGNVGKAPPPQQAANTITPNPGPDLGPLSVQNSNAEPQAQEQQAALPAPPSKK